MELRFDSDRSCLGLLFASEIEHGQWVVTGNTRSGETALSLWVRCGRGVEVRPFEQLGQALVQPFGVNGTGEEFIVAKNCSK